MDSLMPLTVCCPLVTTLDYILLILRFYKTRNTTKREQRNTEHRQNNETPRNSGGNNGISANTNGTPAEHPGTTKH